MILSDYTKVVIVFNIVGGVSNVRIFKNVRFIKSINNLRMSLLCSSSL